MNIAEGGIVALIAYFVVKEAFAFAAKRNNRGNNPTGINERLNGIQKAIERHDQPLKEIRDAVLGNASKLRRILKEEP